jgi:hypothetical protein
MRRLFGVGLPPLEQCRWANCVPGNPLKRNTPVNRKLPIDRALRLAPIVGFVLAWLANFSAATAGLLYVATGVDKSIITITPSGAVSTFASYDRLPVSINGVAFDTRSNLYAAISGANFGNGYIARFTPTGVQSTFATGLSNPADLAFDASGNLFVADYNADTTGSIYEYSPAGIRSTIATGFFQPATLGFDSNGDLFVAARARNGVYNSGSIIEITPSGVQSTFASNFGYIGPMGLAFDKNGNLYTTNGFSAVYKFTPTGVSSGFGAVSFPTGALAFDSNGNLFAGANVPGGTASIYEFSPNGIESTFVSNTAIPASFAFRSVPEPPTFILIAVASLLIAPWLRESVQGASTEVSRAALRPHLSCIWQPPESTRPRGRQPVVPVHFLGSRLRVRASAHRARVELRPATRQRLNGAAGPNQALHLTGPH